MDVNEKELRQLQTALKNHEAVTFCRKAPRQFALLVDFRGYSYRIDFAYGWQANTYKSPSDKSGNTAPGPDLAELQALIPVILKVQQDKEAEAIAKAESEKAEEEKAKAEAEAKEADRRQRYSEMFESCYRAHIPGWNRQEWCKEKFGTWSLRELSLEQLEILWAEIERREKEMDKKKAIAQDSCMDEEKAIPGSPETMSLAQLLEQGKKLQPIPDSPFVNPAWRIGFFYNGVPHAAFRDRFQSSQECQKAIDGIMSTWGGIAEAIAKEEAIATPCPNCEGSGLCGGLEDGCECMGDCPNDGLCPECVGKGAIIQDSCMDEENVRILRETLIIAAADKSEVLADRLTENGQNYQMSAKAVSDDLIEVEYARKTIRLCRGKSAFLWELENERICASSEEFMVCDLALIALSQIKQEALDCVLTDVKTLTLKGKALTLKQPWAWAIFNCGKNIENRIWDTSYRGRLFIHAGRAYDHSGAAWIAEKFGVEVPGPGNLPSGAIVGWVELGSISQESFKPNLFSWAIEDHYHWHLKRPYQFHEPIPYQGKLGLYPVEIPFPAPPKWILDNAEAIWDHGSTEILNGEPYRPSSGSEGDWFMGGWCEQCSRLNSCSIPVMSMAGEQPPEWVYWDRKPICLGWEQAIADKPLAYYRYQGLYKVGDSEGNLEEFESAEEAIVFIGLFPKTGKSLASYQLAEEVSQ